MLDIDADLISPLNTGSLASRSIAGLLQPFSEDDGFREGLYPSYEFMRSTCCFAWRFVIRAPS